MARSSIIGGIEILEQGRMVSGRERIIKQSENQVNSIRADQVAADDYHPPGKP